MAWHLRWETKLQVSDTHTYTLLGLLFFMVADDLTLSVAPSVSSLFYIFVLHLTMTIILFSTLCIANLVLHFHEVRDNPDNEDLNGGEVFFKVFQKYWASMVGAFIAILFSIFVFGLCGFHTYLV